MAARANVGAAGGVGGGEGGVREIVVGEVRRGPSKSDWAQPVVILGEAKDLSGS